MPPSEPAAGASPPADPEAARLQEDARREKNWKRWGTYLSERQWGTVREDYSANGDAWNYLPHDHARSRAYRWGEDGLLGICDRQCRVCFALALWNGRDPILKERLFGLTGPEGNHGEDVKEQYFFLDATPTASYAKALYKYPAGGVSLRSARPPRPGEGGAGIRAPRHRDLRRGALLRRLRRVRQGGHRRPPDPRHRRQPRSRGGGGPPPAHALAPQHLELGARRRGVLAQGVDPAGRGRRPAGPSPRSRPPPPRRGDRSGHPAVHRERDQRRAPLRSAQSQPLRQGRLSPLPDRGAERRRQSGGRGDQGRLPLPAGDPARRRGRFPLPADPGGELDAGGFRRRFHPGFRDARRRGGRLLRHARRARPLRGRPAGGAPVVRGALLVQAVLPLRGQGLARRRPRPAATPRGAAERAQRLLAPPPQPRRDLHARHLGVSLVGGLGPRLPHRGLRQDRPRIRQGAAPAAAARMVHAPQRPDPGLRVDLLGRQSAGARLGLLARLQDVRAPRGTATGCSWSGSSRSS